MQKLRLQQILSLDGYILEQGTDFWAWWEAHNDDDELDDEDRTRLHAALDRADDELRAGKGIPGEQVIAELRARKL